MKVIKPQRLGLLYRVYEEKRKYYLVVTLTGFFAFDNPPELLTEISMWKFVATELGKDAMLDFGMPKPRGELLITGSCYPPDKIPLQASTVRVHMGSIRKTLYVFGDRHWKFLEGAPVISEAEPFTRMEISYANAFGGEGYAMNPLGKGFAQVIDGKGKDILPLPNIEHPKHLVGSPSDDPSPAGFGPYDLTWPQRMSKAGTYDKKWLEERFPGYAQDMDWTIFNTAPEDQWLEGFFKGDEHFNITHMHPENSHQVSSLPGVSARCFIRRKNREQAGLTEIETRAETVWLFPHAERGIVLFRGMIEVEEDDAADVTHAMIACDSMANPRSYDHYLNVFEQRIDPDRGFLFALRDSDLMPADEGESARRAQEPGEIEALSANEDILRKNIRRGAEKDMEELKEKIRSFGLDPALYVPEKLPEEPKVDLERIDLQMLEIEEMRVKMAKETEQRLAEAKENLRRVCEKHGMDFEQVMESEKKKACRRPSFSADEVLGKLREAENMLKESGIDSPEFNAQAGDPELEKKLRLAEKKFLEGYKMNAHHFQPFTPLEKDRAQALRLAMTEACAAGESFAGRDFSGGDFSGLDLSNAHFRDALLEWSNFSGAKLEKADFTGAVLTGSDFSNAVLTGANFREANLGRVNFQGVIADGGADFSNSVLAEADLTGGNFSFALMNEADLSGALFERADLSNVKAAKLLLVMGCRFTDINFSGADLNNSLFVNAVFSNVDFTEANLNTVVFMGLKASNCVFRKADMTNLRVVMDSEMEKADFVGAVIEDANLRGTKLMGAVFANAVMNRADFSECDLREANFYRAVCKEARFDKADLSAASLISANMFKTSLRKALFYAADFRDANLFAADFTKSKGDVKTNFREANLDMTLLKAWKPE